MQMTPRNKAHTHTLVLGNMKGTHTHAQETDQHNHCSKVLSVRELCAITSITSFLACVRSSRRQESPFCAAVGSEHTYQERVAARLHNQLCHKVTFPGGVQRDTAEVHFSHNFVARHAMNG